MVTIVSVVVVVVVVQDKRTHAYIVKHITMSDVQFCLFPFVHFHKAKNWSSPRCQQGNHELCSVHEPRDNPGRVASVQEGTQLNMDNQC